MNELKQDLWSKAHVGIPHLDIEANDAVILGYQVAEFLSEVNSNYIRYKVNYLLKFQLQ